MKKVKVTCYHFWSDWTDMTPREIDVDEWNCFELQYRCETWYIIGSKYDKKNDKWYKTELTDHGIVGTLDLEKFIKVAGEKIKKISTNNYKSDLIEQVAKLHINLQQ